MTWHLKDRELERKLNDLVGGNEFTEALNQASSIIGIKNTITVKFGPNTGHIKGSFRCYFEVEELINIGYDPHNWNEYPNVIPPEGILMRIETDKFRDCAIFKNGHWFSDYGVEASSKITCPVRRFRPWEDS